MEYIENRFFNDNQPNDIGASRGGQPGARGRVRSGRGPDMDAGRRRLHHAHGAAAGVPRRGRRRVERRGPSARYDGHDVPVGWPGGQHDVPAADSERDGSGRGGRGDTAERHHRGTAPARRVRGAVVHAQGALRFHHQHVRRAGDRRPGVRPHTQRRVRVRGV